MVEPIAEHQTASWPSRVEPTKHMAWQWSICGDSRGLSRPNSQSPLFPELSFGASVLRKKIPSHPRSSPASIHFLRKTKSTPLPSRIIPVPVSSPSNSSRVPRERPAASRTASSAVTARGEGDAELLTGGRGWIPPNPLHIRSPPFLESDGCCRLLQLLSGNLPSLALFLLPRLTTACRRHIHHVSSTNLR
jgi:hypothetical protein